MTKEELRENLTFKIKDNSFDPQDIIDTCEAFILSKKQMKRKDIAAIAEKICGLDVNDIYKKDRSGNIPFAKHLYFWYCYTFTDATCEAIGLEFNQGHSNVIYSKNKINNWIEIKDSMTIERVEKMKLLTGN